MGFWRPRSQEYRFDEEHIVRPGEPVVITRVYTQYAWPALSRVLEQPESLDAVFRGYHPVRSPRLRAQLGGVVRELIGRDDGENMPVPHLGIQIPGALLGGESSPGVPLKRRQTGIELGLIGLDCDWTLPDIWEQATAEVAHRYAPNIPDELPGDFTG